VQNLVAGQGRIIEAAGLDRHLRPMVRGILRIGATISLESRSWQRSIADHAIRGVLAKWDGLSSSRAA
jgi:hypothetical protein